jgi:hypothetical protein
MWTHSLTTEYEPAPSVFPAQKSADALCAIRHQAYQSCTDTAGPVASAVLVPPYSLCEFDSSKTLYSSGDSMAEVVQVR